MTSVSSSKASSLGGPSRHDSETQRIITTFALGRPEPYGRIPSRRSSGSQSSATIQRSLPSTSPPDVNLSGIEGFDYDESWSLGGQTFLSSGKGAAEGKGKEGEADARLLTASPTKDQDSERPARAGSTLSRSSTVSSRRSSNSGSRRPSLLLSSISPPLTTSYAVSATGEAAAAASARTSKSLAEKGEMSAIPSLYDVSRGRSARVKLGGTWLDRRGTSASVLFNAGEEQKKLLKAEKARRQKERSGGRATWDAADKRSRKSSEGTDTALFSSDDGLSASSEDEEELEGASRTTSRRSSIDKDRRRGLKILLGPSMGRQGSVESGGALSHSLAATSASGGVPPDDKSSSDIQNDSVDALADDEDDGSVGSSALLARRRSTSGKRLLGSSLRSTSSQRPMSRLEVILAGLTPDGLSDSSRSISGIEPVSNDADPLLGPAFGSVSDLINVDAVVWDDQHKQNTHMRTSSNSNTSQSSKKDRKQIVEEQEQERRLGFAAAYQNRLSSLLWSSKTNSQAEKKADESATSSATAPAASSESESLLTSSWRHLTRLPNLLLMPTLGQSRSRATQAGDASTPEATPRMEGVSVADEAVAAQLLSMPTSPEPAVMLAPSPPLSATSLKEVKGRGVMNPLEGDADVSAYVSGLGLPIDPDLELSSVVHLQTFRTSHIPTSGLNGNSISRSRRGSLERPASVETHYHRRAFSDNRMEAPSPDLLLQKKLSDELLRRSRDARQSQTEKHDGQSCGAVSRGCSRPAVQAPVPGGYSAYNSSESDEGEESKASDGENRVERHAAKGRGRRSGGRRRSSSPPTASNRKQCAIGLFDGRANSRSRTDEVEAVVVEEGAPMVRVRSTPNLPSLSAGKEARQGRHGRRSAAGGRGRAGSVKLVSASIAVEDDADGKSGEIPSAGKVFLPASHPLPVPAPSSAHRSPLGFSLPNGGDMPVRPSMVSNGAHLLMLSLELEMMRHRKITCSLKPRWLKARVRSDSAVNRLGSEGASSADVSRECNLHRAFSQTKPKIASGLRFEVA